MAVDTRLLAASLAVAALISVGGGYIVSRSDDGGPVDAELSSPGVEQIPTIGTNAVLAGTPLASTQLLDNEGNVVSTADLLGQPLVINVWNSSCEQARAPRIRRGSRRPRERDPIRRDQQPGHAGGERVVRA